jgi:hypothetical protein
VVFALLEDGNSERAANGNHAGTVIGQA